MTTLWKHPVFILPVVLLSLVNCGSDTPLHSNEDITTVNAMISDCGGFDSATRRPQIGIPFTKDSSTYCDAERLYWFYNNETETLSLMNSRVLLNCCGDRTITASNEDGVIAISENDQPEDGTGRCRCVCVFDFFIEITGVPYGVITLRLDIAVDDEIRAKWQGEIDLKEESGVIIVDSKPLTDGCP